MNKIDVFLVFQIFVVETVLEQKPGYNLNAELLDTIKSDCDLISSHFEELELDAFSADVENDFRDGVIELHFNNFVLTPSNVLLCVFPHVSNIQFRTKDDQILMKMTYKDLFWD